MTPQPAASAKSLPLDRDIATAIGLLVVVTAGAYIPTPMYPVYQQLFGFSDLVMTLIYATFAAVSAPALLLFGPASDALGKRFVILLCIAFSAVGALCFLFATGPAWLLIARVAQGLSIAAATAAGLALIVERTAPERRAWASVIATVAFVGGSVIGTLASGVIVEYAPFPRYAPYVLLLVLLAIGWVRASRIESFPTMPLRAWRPVRPQVPREIRTRFVLAAASGSAAWIAMTLFLSVIPALLARSAGITSPVVSAGVLAAMLMCSLLTQLLAVRVSAVKMQLAGLCALSVGLIGLAFDGGGSIVPTLVCAVLSGLGNGLAYAGATASIDMVTTNRNRGAVNAALYIFFYLATGAPPIAVGLLTAWIPLGTALSWISWFGAAVAVATIAAIISLGLHARGRAEKCGRGAGGAAIA
ncbi:MFS transporter [Arthrobacter sp. OAP107]|uniref:MFS transporter n=1 Tax=Arthrobacter sp. OAP107 TaxID=3156445 RepID=UPI003399F1E7